MNPPPRVSPHSVWARRVMGWALGGAAATGLVALVTDSVLLLLGGASPRSALGVSLTSAALGSFIALAASPALLVVVLLTEQLRRTRSAIRFLWPVPFAASALAAGLLLTDAIYRPRAGAYEVISVLFAIAMVVIVLANRQDRRWRNLILFTVGASAFAIDVATPSELYRELHDLLSLITIGCVLTGLVGMRRRIAAASLPALMGAVTLLMAVAILETMTVDGWAPGWRPLAAKLARYEPRLARACRALADFDGDGFSPLAWGGDCDDFDPDRNPAHRESRRYKDANCNGVVPPAHPTDSDRGLAPPVGDPDLAADDQVDLVLLVTIDCFRYDAFRPDIMPHLWELARHGLVFTRLYTGGSRTKLSLPLVMRGSDDGPPLPVRLAKSGIRAMALFGFTDPTLNQQVLAGFKESYVPAHARWSARELTNLALAKIHSTAGQRRFLWVHYFDAHYPYYPPAEFVPREVPQGMPDSYGPYLSNLSYVDSEFARLINQLRRDDLLNRTLILITADHGEGFGQHGVPLHGISAYDMLVHVLGVMLAPGLAPGRYDGLVSHRDIPATVLGGFGIEEKQPDVELFGRSWLRLLDAPPGAELHKFVVTRSFRAASGYEYSTPMAGIVKGKLKLIETFEDHLTEMYDPVDDPGERDNLLTKMPKEAAELDDNLQMYRDVDGFP